MNYSNESYGLRDHVARLRTELEAKDRARRLQAERRETKRDTRRQSERYNHAAAVWYQVAFWANRL